MGSFILRFLDVGCGCGILTACGAFLAGPRGVAVGLEIRPKALSLTRRNLRARADDPAFAAAAGTPKVKLANVFSLAALHKVVVVGCSKKLHTNFYFELPLS